MRWYSGGIADAITTSKSKGAIFVVYIEGNDEKSQQITSQIENQVVGTKLSSDNFVAIKLEANSVPHQQFSEIYKQSPVPSIYFIGKTGLPLKIITQSTDTSNLSKEIDEVLEKAGVSPLETVTQNAASASQSLINTEQSVTTKPPNVVCENGVCTIKQDPEPSAPSQPEGENSIITAEEKLERARKLIEAKRLEVEREAKENERRREVERRKTGQEVQKIKKMQEDQELKQLKEDREREKRIEREAKERVLAQIAQDKADRASRFQPAASSTPTNKENVQPAPVPSTSKADTARLQFKLPDGTSKTQDFPSSDKLISVVNYVKTNLNLPSRKFTLSTTFPRRQFTENDHAQTLQDLQLTPNAVILVLPLSHGTVSTSQGPGGLTGFIWTLVAPLIGILNFIKAFLGFGDLGHVSGDEPSGGYSSGGSSSKPENPSEPKKPSDSTTIRKQGNVRRLADVRKDDDDNNTWNGNSTQQM